MSEITADKVKALLEGIKGDGAQTKNVHAFTAAAPEVFRAFIAKCDEVDVLKDNLVTAMILVKSEECGNLRHENQRLQVIIDKQREENKAVRLILDHTLDCTHAPFYVRSEITKALALTQQQTGGAV